MGTKEARRPSSWVVFRLDICTSAPGFWVRVWIFINALWVIAPKMSIPTMTAKPLCLSIMFDNLMIIIWLPVRLPPRITYYDQNATAASKSVKSCESRVTSPIILKSEIFAEMICWWCWHTRTMMIDRDHILWTPPLIIKEVKLRS